MGLSGWEGGPIGVLQGIEIGTAPIIYPYLSLCIGPCLPAVDGLLSCYFSGQFTVSTPKLAHILQAERLTLPIRQSGLTNCVAREALTAFHTRISIKSPARRVTNNPSNASWKLRVKFCISRTSNTSFCGISSYY
jgi:hypothetical protein